MPVKRRRNKARNHSLSLPERWSLELGEDSRRPAFENDDLRRAAWERHREQLLEGEHAGRRPQAWWDYESPVRRNYKIEQCHQLYEMGALAEDEPAVLMKWWRERYEHANAPDYFGLCMGPGKWLEGAAARRAEYAWAGIPPTVLKQFKAERARRTKTIRKLAVVGGRDMSLTGR
jgi:hypothetical protein